MEPRAMMYIGPLPHFTLSRTAHINVPKAAQSRKALNNDSSAQPNPAQEAGGNMPSPPGIRIPASRVNAPRHITRTQLSAAFLAYQWLYSGKGRHSSTPTSPLSIMVSRISPLTLLGCRVNST